MTEPHQDALADVIYSIVRRTCSEPAEGMLVLSMAMAKIYFITHKPDADLEDFLKDHANSVRELIQALKPETIQ